MLQKADGGKPRHEKVAWKTLLKKNDEDFTEIVAEYDWTPLDTYCEDKWPKRKFRSDKARRAHLALEGIPLQKDDAGVDGVAVAKLAGGRKNMRVGRRIGVVKEKGAECLDGKDWIA
jgi:hypothetical protein